MAVTRDNIHDSTEGGLPGPTLESGPQSNQGHGRHPVWKRFKERFESTRLTRPQDQVEIKLREYIDRKLISSWYGYYLLQSYLEFKHRSPFKNKVGDRNLRYWEFGPIVPAQGLPSDTSEGHDNATLAKEDDTFSSWIIRIQNSMESQEPRTLKIVGLVENPSRQDMGALFSSTTKASASLSGNLERLHLRPAGILLFAVTSSWNILSQPHWPSSTPTNLHELKRQKPQVPPSLEKYEILRKPSVYQSFPGIVWGDGSPLPGNLDPSRGKNEIFLHWQRSPERFRMDFEVYFWEYHKKFPEFEYAKIILSPSTESTDASRLLISFRSCHALENLSRNRSDAPTSRYDTSGLSPAWNRDALHRREIVFSICNVFDVMCQDTAEFIQTSYDEVNKRSVRGRKSPSLSKIKYMMHLNDCCESAHEGIKHGIKVLDAVTKWVYDQEQATRDLNLDGTLSHRECLSTMVSDLTFLKSRLTSLKKEIRAGQVMVRKHYQLTQESRVWRIQVIAAIFLPLSLATSIFGMNINASDSPDLFWNTTQMKKEAQDLPPDSQTATNIIASAMWYSAGQESFDWITFAVTAICLSLTLPIAFAIGSMLRLGAKLVIRYAAYWRIAVVYLVCLFMTFSIIGKDFPLPLWYLYVASNSLLILYQGVQAGIAFWKKRFYDSILWTLSMALSVVCFLISLFVDTIVPVTLFPWLTFFVYSFRKQWEKLKERFGIPAELG